MVGDGDNADDIVQDTFLVLYEALDKGTSIEYPGTWLYKVTYHKSLDCLQRKKRLIPLETANRSTIEYQEASNEEEPPVGEEGTGSPHQCHPVRMKPGNALCWPYIANTVPTRKWPKQQAYDLPRG
jgi:DNA-directed RNA polymerase specialized sigma24 family protein